MRVKRLVVLTAAILTGFLLSLGGANAASYSDQLSANVALNSFAYDYLEKLDGLGYLADMRTGTKPYTRIQFARWTKQMMDSQRKDIPPYARAMLAALRQEFQPELDVLSSKGDGQEFGLKSWSLAEDVYHGNTLAQKGTKSTYQPLNVNNDGYRYGTGGNEIMAMTFEGKLGDDLVLSFTPRMSYDSTHKGETSFEYGYVKSDFNNVAIQVGKDAVAWGQGSRGNLMFSNNTEPQSAVRFTNIEPNRPGGLLTFLGRENTTVSYSVLETNRDIPYPSFVAMRFDFIPSNNFTFALARADIVGGKGRMLNSGDYYDWLLGRNAGQWTSSPNDKWNTQAGGDFRWRLPSIGGIQVYGEVYGEDQHRRVIPYPYRLAWIYGVYIPRFSAEGSWDACFELHQTDPSWYIHGTYTDGWVFKGNILGDPIGNNAQSFYGKVTHYNQDGSSISLNFERVTMDRTDPAAQKIRSGWIGYRAMLGKDLQVDLSAGLANISNKDFVTGSGGHNYIFSVEATKRY